MIIMDLKINNFFAFENFHINFSYPKKIVNSYLEDEFLEGYPNFRYQKINIIMGANATGKTSLGKMILSIFNLINNLLFSSFFRLSRCLLVFRKKCTHWKAYTLLVEVDCSNLSFNNIANLKYISGLFNSLVCNLRNVDKTV